MAIPTHFWTETRPAAPAPRATPPARVPSSFRGDIEGMRAVAVLLVLLGHAGVPYLAGGFVGVDVFFVISGFLITGLLLDELDRRGQISLAGFYARRAKRLLPAAATVLVATLVLTYFFIPRTRWSATAWDVVASAGYVMNWRMAAQSLDYVAVNAAPSAVQHFWSLAVEEQFYLVWPLLLILLGWVGRHWRRGRRGLFLAGLALIAVPSFLWALRTSPADPSAYFVTTTRMWELALGGAIAVAATGLARAPRAPAAVLAWAGLVTVVGSAALIDTESGFPGHAALGPTLGTAVVIAFGTAAGRAGPVLLLGRRPLRAVGALSYSLYLWHWPLLIAAQARFGDLNTGEALAVVAVSAIPAVLTYHFIENPVRRSRSLTDRPSLALRVGALCTGATALAAVAFHLAVPTSAAPGTASVIMGQVPGSTASASTTRPPGAAALGAAPRTSPAGVPVDRVSSMTPDPMSAVQDAQQVKAPGCHVDLTSATPKDCVYGKPDGTTRVALVGDSHADHWVPAMRVVAEKNGWRLVTYTKSGCPFLAAEIRLNGRPYTSCRAWNDAVRERLLGADRPDVLVVTHSEYPIVGEAKTDVRAAMARELRRTWTGMVEAGVPVVVIRDTPLQLKDIAACVAQNPEHLTRCTTPRDEALNYGGGPAQEKAAAGLDGVRLIDLNDWICPASRCAPVIGGVLVWRDGHHLTATYAETLAPRLDIALKPAMAALRAHR
ncbi:acyltransferase family protein [Micromonospora sp. NPDC018662]|uniref:acyltransferase family protein n=1 Tax=Micromonospora sp. NPDC018662 TaxID=3364238 RepID=UPI003787AA12